ncbi:hypothetical protein D3C81_1976780 [compost metagenome]
MAHAERHETVDAQASARRRALRCFALGAVDIVEDALALHEEGVALGRRVQLARAALEQTRAEPRFQAIDELADGRRRQGQAARGGGERPRFHHGDEHGHLERAVDVLPGHY